MKRSFSDSALRKIFSLILNRINKIDPTRIEYNKITGGLNLAYSNISAYRVGNLVFVSVGTHMEYPSVNSAATCTGYLNLQSLLHENEYYCIGFPSFPTGRVENYNATATLADVKIFHDIDVNISATGDNVSISSKSSHAGTYNSTSIKIYGIATK